MAQGNADKIIPIFIERITPSWFAGLFLLGMFSAAMSTLSSQYHVGGTSLGHDVYEVIRRPARERSARLSQLDVILMIVATLIWAWMLPGSIVARAAAFFSGLCASTFLPVYMLGLYWKGMTQRGAVVAMVGGFCTSMFWLLFVHVKESAVVGLCRLITGKPSIFADATPMTWTWLPQYMDPNLVGLPMGLALAVVVSLATRKMGNQHLERCWINF